MSAPRVRFAPSPTGFLHVGGARTALFNWLFARRYGGVFVLRIEDTDLERSSREMVEGILDGLRWLGLDWDEGPGIGGRHGPYYQSQRLDRHRAMAERLVASGHAYYCYCTADELKARRQAAEAAGGRWQYERTCRALSAGEVAARERSGRPRALRFKVPDGIVRVDDLVHGAITFDSATIEDFVILRSDLHPTYHLAVVCDDVEMEITHVVRGDDHISNTPKQLLLYDALHAPVPRFAHVPLILGPDKKRLSKRHGATSVMEYASQGYLPEAMFNFLALLGWSPGSGQELFARDDLIAAFTLEGISGGNAVFNPEKLEWYNHQHIARLPSGELTLRLKPLLETARLWDERWVGDRQAWLHAALELLKPRARRLDDFIVRGAFLFSDELEYDAAAVRQHIQTDDMAAHLAALDAAFSQLAAFDPASIEAVLRSIAAARGVKSASLVHAVRVATTGTTVGPGLFELLSVIGRERIHDRLMVAVRLASSAPA